MFSANSRDRGEPNRGKMTVVFFFSFFFFFLATQRSADYLVDNFNGLNDKSRARVNNSDGMRLFFLFQATISD
jgi:hypothetical protein